MPQRLDQPYDSWIGRTAKDPSGQRIGKVEDIYTDDDTGRPEWLAVASGRSGTGVCFLPVTGASWEDDDDDLWVPFPREKVREAPHAGAEGRLSREQVVRLRAYYGCEPQPRPRRTRPRLVANARVSLFAAVEEEPGEEVTHIDLDEPAGPSPSAGGERVPLSASFDDGVGRRADSPLDLHQPPPPRQQVARGRVVLTASFDEEPGGRADSPLSWNHDDRIDSIRPPADRGHALHR